MRDGHRIVLVELAAGRPFSVVTMGKAGDFAYYDFEWSKREERFLFHESGNSFYLEGANSDFWLADGVPRELLSGGKERPTGKRLQQLPTEWDIANMLKDTEVEGVYCSICEDWLAWSDNNSLCDHIHWCEVCGWWSGAGHDEPCDCLQE